MKKIGIIFAMKEELNELLSLAILNSKKNIYDLIFYECNINNNECILVESGIGKVNASRCTQVLIDNYNIDYVFNIGVAGSVDSNLKVCDIVIGEKLVQHDFDLTAFNYEKGYIPNIGIYINSDNKLLSIAKKYKDNNTYIGNIASGDIFCTEKGMSEKINKKFDALCVEMEGAAIAQVCYLCKVPFLVIRSISDSPSNNDNNKITYDEFLEISSKNVAKYLENILKDLYE